MPDALVEVAVVDGLGDGQSLGSGPTLALVLVVLPLEKTRGEQGEKTWLKLR